MTPEILFVYGLFVAVILLLSSRKVKGDIIGGLILVILAISGILTPQEAFSGFSSSPVIVIATVYIIGRGIYRTGLAVFMADRLLKAVGRRENGMVTAVMLLSSFLSAFLSNLGVVSILLPVVTRIAKKIGVHPRKLLLPLVMGSVFGGLLTTVGTPPTFVVVEMLREKGYGLGVLSVFPLGATMLVLALAFMALVGVRLLGPAIPAEEEKRRPGTRTVEREYGLRRSFYRLQVLKSSAIVGHPLSELGLREEYRVNVVGVRRAVGGDFVPVDADFVPQPGNVLIVSGELFDVTRMAHALGLEMLGVVDLKSLLRSIDPESTVAEMMVSPRSPLVGKSLAEYRLRDRYPMHVLSVLRNGRPIGGVLRNLKLRVGDMLLVTGTRDAIKAVSEDGVLTLLSDIGIAPGQRVTLKAAVAGVILLGTIAALVSGAFPVTITLSVSAMLMALTGCVPGNEVYKSIDWGVIVLVAGLIPLGVAMEKTGAGDLASRLVVSQLAPLGPTALMMGFYFISALMTQGMSNTGTALLVAPLAMSSAVHLGYSPIPFAMAAAIGASASFLNPAGDLTILMIMGPGEYSILDILKLNGPLFIFMTGVVWVLIPRMWGF